jgi:hypothetical protein
LRNLRNSALNGGGDLPDSSYVEKILNAHFARALLGDKESFSWVWDYYSTMMGETDERGVQFHAIDFKINGLEYNINNITKEIKKYDNEETAESFKIFYG